MKNNKTKKNIIAKEVVLTPEQRVADFYTKDKNLGGRPKVIDDAILGKLREAFLIGCTDEEACFYANINKDTMYDFQKINIWFSDWKEALKDNPTIQARKTLFAGLGKSDDAKWFLERKKKKEFSSRSELTGEDGTPLSITTISYSDVKKKK